MRSYYTHDAKRVYYLSMEFLMGRTLIEQPAQPRLRRGVPRGAAASWASICEQVREIGARRGAGQRRPRPARGLLPRFDGDAGPARLRLRHPLRVRHVRAAHRGRPAGRASRQLAALRQSLGIPAPGSAVSRSSSAAAWCSSRDERRRAAPSLGRHRRRDGDGLRHARFPATARQTVNNMRLWSAKASRDFDLKLFQRGQLHQGGRGQERVGEPVQGALPGRHHRHGPRAAPEAAVFLRQRLAAGHPAPLQQAPRGLRRSCRTRSRSS